ncbi:hypothetical protein J18TS1_12240 [Oceanobacillus oncorhynchi subsp. incaldanensis]|uniref:YopX family protein n=1 Tax=Oceanobacillus oncorhynchi TaxID=545501 RepID=UPI001B1C3299|nr:YopX family protein [Oceanobacillus oncorhynchi]GIO18124.1 hypothetical protein J18TS1_12240 [Oceanobacillus oncorhynchi subsp. incaldanensis]
MREIKFRAWDKANKNGWIPKPIKEMIYFNILNPPEYLGNTYDEEGTWERRFVVMQPIGLKDKNDDEIYGSDYVKDHKGHVYEVRYNNFCAFMLYPLDGDDFMAIYPGIELEVIGNIYENPELLEGATNGSS